MGDLISSSRLFLVLGLGKTGWSVARFLAAKNHRFMVIDDAVSEDNKRRFAQEFDGVFLGGSTEIELDWSLISELILSPGIPRSHKLVQEATLSTIPVISDVELFARYASAPVVAITGSNGKTTVTTLVGLLIEQAGHKVAVGGNIGKPVLDLLNDEVEFYVLELSSFQLESTQHLKPRVATVLNISPDHMDRYNNIQSYHQAKQRIYMGAQTVVTNHDDPLTEPPLAAGVNRISFTLRQPDLKQFGLIEQNGEQFLAYGLTPLVSVNDIKIRGQHNYANALAALALGHTIGLPFDSMIETLKAFLGLPHRCQVVGEHGGVTFINDSKATNIGATVAALNGLKKTDANIVLIAGGDAKGADLSELTQSLTASVKVIVALGKDGPKFASLCSDHIDFSYAESMAHAVEIALSKAEDGDLVLLSPACSSLDMFLSFEDRGDQFTQCVRQLCK